MGDAPKDIWGLLINSTWESFDKAYPIILRDYFAGQVISGMFSDRGACFFGTDDLKKFAESAYEIADAMMEARK